VTTSAIERTRVAPRPTAVVAESTSWDRFPALWKQLLDEVYAFVRGDGSPFPPGLRWQNVMLYKDDTPNVEVGVLAPQPFASDGRVIASELPGGEVLTAVHRRDFTGLGETHDAILSHAQANGLELAGPRWEIYGHHSDDPDEIETEIFWLLR
jgi:effector-binding domain-containing protein